MLECFNEDYTFAGSKSRLLYVCHHSKWNVFDSNLCPNDEESCMEPKHQNCQKITGCDKLHNNFQDRVKYDPKLKVEWAMVLTLQVLNRISRPSKFCDFSIVTLMFSPCHENVMHSCCVKAFLICFGFMVIGGRRPPPTLG